MGRRGQRHHVWQPRRARDQGGASLEARPALQERGPWGRPLWSSRLTVQSPLGWGGAAAKPPLSAGLTTQGGSPGDPVSIPAGNQPCGAVKKMSHGPLGPSWPPGSQHKQSQGGRSPESEQVERGGAPSAWGWGLRWWAHGPRGRDGVWLHVLSSLQGCWPPDSSGRVCESTGCGRAPPPSMTSDGTLEAPTPRSRHPSRRLLIMALGQRLLARGRPGRGPRLASQGWRVSVFTETLEKARHL